MASVAFHSSDAEAGEAEAARLLHGRRPVLGPGRFLLGLVAAVAVGVAVAVWLGRSGPEPVEQAVAEPARPVWVDIVKPFQNYALRSPLVVREPVSYEARRHRTGGGRQDILTFGTFQPGPWMRLTIYRTGTEEVADAAFFVDMARRAAEAGLGVTRSGQPTPLATRFGAFETADLTLARDDSALPCLGFRLNGADGGLRLSGLSCGTAAKPMDRLTLACTLDRLEIVSYADDKPLQKFFVDAELNRGETCGGAKGATAPPPKLGWLDPQSPAPPLKGKPEERKKRVSSR